MSQVETSSFASLAIARSRGASSVGRPRVSSSGNVDCPFSRSQLSSSGDAMSRERFLGPAFVRGVSYAISSYYQTIIRLLLLEPERPL